MKKIIPDKENPKYRRINQIAALISAKPHSISELSQKLDVSSKTIQRDLYEVLKPQGAIKSGRMWSLDSLMANDELGYDERTIINILDDIAKNMGFDFYSKAHLLLERITSRLNHPILTDINAEKLGKKDFANFKLLEDAIREKIKITCKYNDYEFTVKPLKIAMFEGFWYLLLLDTNKNDAFKKFHLKSISDIRTLGEKFDISREMDAKVKSLNSVWATPEKPKTARLLLAPQIVKYFQRKPHAKQTITGKDGDGSVIIDIDYTHVMEIKPLIYYYIPFIKVLEPKELADMVRDEIGEYLKQINI